MNRRSLLLTGLAVAALVATSSTLAFAKAKERVYWALSKDAAGQANSKVLKVYKCPTPLGDRAMLKVAARMALEVTPHACDEYARPGKITASWTIYVRDDTAVHFGTHVGPFTWVDSDGNTWKGTMRGTIGCGTHRAPIMDDCERCRVQNHFEGCLNGRAVAGPLFDRYRAAGLPAPLIEATYAGFYAGHLKEGLAAVKMAIDGVHVLWCP